MIFDTKYLEARERWTFKNQTMNDDETLILSVIEVQAHDGCSFSALGVTLEANIRVQSKINVRLSRKHLKKLNDDSKIKMPYERSRMIRLLTMIKTEGVFEEQQYEDIIKGTLREGDAQKRFITDFTPYFLNKENIGQSLHAALHQMRKGGPLLVVIPISRNYHDCYKSGLLYRFDRNQVVKKQGIPQTHALSVVSFGLEAKTPFLECQDSRGIKFSRHGFLNVDISSVKELYSIRC